LNCNIRAIALTAAALSLITLTACETTASAGFGRPAAEQQQYTWPDAGVGMQFGTD